MSMKHFIIAFICDWYKSSFVFRKEGGTLWGFISEARKRQWDRMRESLVIGERIFINVHQALALLGLHEMLDVYHQLGNAQLTSKWNVIRKSTEHKKASEQFWRRLASTFVPFIEHCLCACCSIYWHDWCSCGVLKKRRYLNISQNGRKDE